MASTDQMSYRLSYLENFHFSNFQHPASKAANKLELAPLCPGGRTPRRRQRHASEVDLEIESYLARIGT